MEQTRSNENPKGTGKHEGNGQDYYVDHVQKKLISLDNADIAIRLPIGRVIQEKDCKERKGRKKTRKL